MYLLARERDVSIWLWLYVPILIIFLVFVINTCLSDSSDGVSYSVRGYYFYYHSLADFLINNENGLIESATVFILIIAIMTGCYNFILRNSLPTKYLSYWFLLVAVSCIYFAGEEISWGQHLFSWETPDLIKRINDQKETNLHNISSWFDQKPRFLVEICILIGGIFLPLIFKIKKVVFTVKDWQFWFFPSFILVPVSILTISIKIPERLSYLDYKLFLSGSDLDIIQEKYFILFYGIRLNEIQELYIAYFFMLYLLQNYKRLNYMN